MGEEEGSEQGSKVGEELNVWTNNPHDRLFKYTFSRADTAASFLRENLPSEASKLINWTTLTGNAITSYGIAYASVLYPNMGGFVWRHGRCKAPKADPASGVVSG